MTTRKLHLVAALMLLLGSAKVLAQETDARLDEIFGEHEIYAAAFDRLQQAVADGDADSVAAMIAFPINVTIDGEARQIATEEDFVTHYDDIVTPRVKEAVLEQDYEALFVNVEGIMIGDGEVWFGGLCTDDACADVDVRILAINN